MAMRELENPIAISPDTAKPPESRVAHTMNTSSSGTPVAIWLIIVALTSAALALGSALIVFMQGGGARDATKAGGTVFATSMGIGIAAIGLLRA
ncbi:hypothetical protein J7E97_27910 [Streptomyces sp. ISL-66]|uniref:hypothetical protein n=1 Tax=Streptomyces sp. ISL-66 TaxID=2819186 RepID=UPI001BEA052A|nr:hypothetical protein [Streptomyces sp. ISL-66]MBT2471586.1 hypothetical protein [Streptomyces sp. ISL-66]